LVGRLRSFVSRRKRVAGVAQRLLDEFPPLRDAVLQALGGEPRERYRQWIAAYDTLGEDDLAALRDESARWQDAPLLSLFVPVADANDDVAQGFAESLRAQPYERWELQFVGATAPAEAWNAALESSASEFVVVADPAVALRPHALFLLAYTIRRHPDVLVVYGDDDAIDEEGARSDHYFKPDWSEALLRCQNYLGGLVCVRRSRALLVGGFEEELDDDRAWGLFLRLTAGAPPQSIHHLPFVVSHRRATPAHAHVDDGERRQRVARAVEQRLARIGERAVRVKPVGERSYRPSYVPAQRPPAVSVIVPTTCRLEMLRPCLGGLLERTSYPKLELLVVVNGSRRLGIEQQAFLREVTADPRARTLFFDDDHRSFNFSRVTNWAAEQARGELLCLLNDDTEVIESGWLSAMVGTVRQDRVAAVGALLLYQNGRIQHGGVIVGAGRVAAHAYAHEPHGTTGYHDRALVDQDVSCVTAACMLVRRDVFAEVGGFDEALPVRFNDVDFCLRVHAAGWRIVWTPSAELYHKESATIGGHDMRELEEAFRSELDLIRRRWSDYLDHDPHYNPNLSLDALQLWQPAFPPRVRYPWRQPGRAQVTPAPPHRRRAIR